MSELGTALRELADRQHPIGGPDAGDLWSQGQRRVRRRRALGAAVAAVVAAAIGLGTLFVHEPVVVMPAGQVHAPGYPDQVYRPSRWLSGTDAQGPLGQLAVIAPSLRGNEPGIFGISATTGEYRFLDLPGWVVGSHVSLAPDGKHVAYWITGHTSKTPYPDPGLAADGRRGQPIAGMAIYDTVTGEVQRTRFATQHGMSDEDLDWINSQTVLFGEWQLLNRHAARRFRDVTVGLGSRVATTFSDRADVLNGTSRTSDGLLLRGSTDGLRFDTVPDVSASGFAYGPPSFRLPKKLPAKHSTGENATYSYVSRAGDTVVVEVNDTPSLTDTLMRGTVQRDGRVTGLTLVGDRFQGVVVLGWHDEHTLLAYGLARGEGEILAGVDVQTGKVTTISKMKEQGWGDQLVPASDLLRGEIFPGLVPPTPMDPRKRDALFVLAGLTVAGAVVWLVRRRRRA